MKTIFAKSETVKRDWYVIDATDKTLGRLATEVANRLRGKHKPEYTPHIDTGDYIVIVNAEKVKTTGNKLKNKIYYRSEEHTSELQSLMRISYAVFCLKKKKQKTTKDKHHNRTKHT